MAWSTSLTAFETSTDDSSTRQSSFEFYPIFAPLCSLMKSPACPQTCAVSTYGPVHFFGPTGKSASCFIFGRRLPPPAIVVLVTFSPVATVFFALSGLANGALFLFYGDAVPSSPVLHTTYPYSKSPGRPGNLLRFVRMQGVEQEVLLAFTSDSFIPTLPSFVGFEWK